MSDEATEEAVVDSTFFQLTVPREMAGEVHSMLRRNVMECITRAGKQLCLDSASYWLEKGGVWELMRDSVRRYMEAVGDWVDE